MITPNTVLSPLRRAAVLALAAAGLGSVAWAQLLYQEGFNDDGSKANPPRYTIIDGGFYEPPFLAGNDAGIPDTQTGPVYWAHNFEVSFVGVPGPTAGRRAMLAWDPAIADTDVTADGWKLVDGAVKWLVNNKANPTVVFTPNMAAAQSLADHFAAEGYTVIDDDETVAEASITADVVMKCPGSVNVSRFAQGPKPVLHFSSPDYDDMLLGSIGATATFEAGTATIATNHPAAGGLTGTFTVATGSHTWNLAGDILPNGSTTVATFVHEVPPTAASLADVDAMVAGTKTSDKATNTVSAVDFADASSGDYTVDNALPGGAAGVWGLVVTGKLNVAAAGKYSFAVASDDGARLRIDLDKNGITAADNVIVNDVAQGHTPKYADVTFAAAGTYDFEITSFNSGGGGDLEFSISTQANGGDTSAISSGSWELLGQTSSAQVTLQGDATATSYVPTGAPDEQVAPLLVVVNGPGDVPPGNVFGGGPFTGFEGTGFFAGSALNKFSIPAQSLSDDFGSYRALQLRPVDVTGKSNVKVTVALAATFLDFETSDRLDIWAYPDGLSSTPVRLARYSAPNGNVKYFADVDHGNAHRLGLAFQDVTYDAPAGSKQLVIEFRAETTWWNETAGFDNVRISAGAITPPLSAITATLSGDDINLAWTGGSPPFLVQGRPDLNSPWIDLLTTSAQSASIPRALPLAFLQVQDSATKEVKLFRATLNGANERPTPVTTSAVGTGFAVLDGNTITYGVSYSGLQGDAKFAHIHGPADANSAAGIIVTLTPASALSTSGYFVGQAPLDAALRANIEGGLTYFNVHSTVYGGGEIRGQLVP